MVRRRLFALSEVFVTSFRCLTLTLVPTLALTSSDVCMYAMLREREQLHIVHKVTDAEVDMAKTLLKNHLYQQVS